MPDDDPSPPESGPFDDLLDDPEHPTRAFDNLGITGVRPGELTQSLITNATNHATGLRSRPLRQQGPPAKTREELRQLVTALRERCQDGYRIEAADWHVLCDALTEVLGVPDPRSGSDPWDIDACDFALIEEREAIQHEPPSVYYLLRHPKL